jgi:hypothetical protein
VLTLSYGKQGDLSLVIAITEESPKPGGALTNLLANYTQGKRILFFTTQKHRKHKFWFLLYVSYGPMWFNLMRYLCVFKSDIGFRCVCPVTTLGALHNIRGRTVPLGNDAKRNDNALDYHGRP